jgi:hypothetical protein
MLLAIIFNTENKGRRGILNYDFGKSNKDTYMSYHSRNL